MIPEELRSGPPRDVSSAAEMFARNRSIVRSCAIGALVLPLVMIGIFWMKYGAVDGLGIGLGVGLGAFVGLFAVAMHVQRRRAERLYRDGVAATGRVSKVVAPGDRNGNAYITAHVEFEDATGKKRTGMVTTIGHQSAVDRREGDEVTVLYLEDARAFAIYTPGLGLVPGVLKA